MTAADGGPATAGLEVGPGWMQAWEICGLSFGSAQVDSAEHCAGFVGGFGATEPFGDGGRGSAPVESADLAALVGLRVVHQQVLLDEEALHRLRDLPDGHTCGADECEATEPTHLFNPKNDAKKNLPLIDTRPPTVGGLDVQANLKAAGKLTPGFNAKACVGPPSGPTPPFLNSGAGNRFLRVRPKKNIFPKRLMENAGLGEGGGSWDFPKNKIELSSISS